MLKIKSLFSDTVMFEGFEVRGGQIYPDLLDFSYPPNICIYSIYIYVYIYAYIYVYILPV